MEQILADFERLIVPAMTQWNHPGFLAYFANSATGEGILGELLTAALNGNGMLWKTSPAVTELEQVALRWLRQWSGLPGGLVRPDLRHRLHQQHARHRRRARGQGSRVADAGLAAGSGGVHVRAVALLHRERRDRRRHRAGLRAQDRGRRRIPHAPRRVGIRRSRPTSRQACVPAA